MTNVQGLEVNPVQLFGILFISASLILSIGFWVGEKWGEKGVFALMMLLGLGLLVTGSIV